MEIQIAMYIENFFRSRHIRLRPTVYSLVLVLGSWVWLQLTAIDGGVSQTPIVRLHVNLSPDATLKTTLCTKLHLLPETKVLFNSC